MLLHVYDLLRKERVFVQQIDIAFVQYAGSPWKHVSVCEDLCHIMATVLLPRGIQCRKGWSFSVARGILGMLEYILLLKF